MSKKGVVIFSQFDLPQTVARPWPDRRIRNKYALRKDDLGRDCVVVTGQYDAYEPTQLARPQVDIQFILDRAELGDLSGLHARPVEYSDLAGMPQNISEIGDMSRRLHGLFDSLSPEVKAFYGSFDSFVLRWEEDLARERAVERVVDERAAAAVAAESIKED